MYLHTRICEATYNTYILQYSVSNLAPNILFLVLNGMTFESNIRKKALLCNKFRIKYVWGVGEISPGRFELLLPPSGKSHGAPP